MRKLLAEIFRGKWTPIRVALRRHGAFKLTLVVTAIVVVLSALITIAIMFLADGSVSIMGLLISIVVPAVLTPLFEYRLLNILLQLDLAEEKLRITSTLDELTRTYNRRYFFDVASQELARVQRYGGTFSIAILDFDNFKNINDSYGHLTGDQVLVELSRLCNINVRLPDIFARYGGDEFIFLFPEADKSKAGKCLERIMASVSNGPIQIENLQITIRLSIGLAEFSPRVFLIDHVLKEADIALYRAKHEGGNKIVLQGVY